MKRIFRTIWNSTVGRVSITLRDRIAQVEIQRKYGNLSWAQRHPKTEHDIEASKINANVYIAVRAISDAIKSLPVDIKEIETIRGVEREVDNNDHPANELLRKPNPEHSWSDIVDHIVKSYLTDGNSILTIERITGPNQRVEIWPRDPRTVDIGTKNRSYRFGKLTAIQHTYPRNRVIHIRDMDVDNPFWGIGRINTIREEIMMDYFINRFNSNFFRYGATLNLMFTPDHDLTEDQHMQILDAMSAEIGGTEKAFKIFINRYAGKFEFPSQKHKDIAFLKLLKHNRERVFGVFGLPPFRGGIMEYANYANALAQDKDFWINTIAPILKVIEDAFNKQMLWPIFGDDIRLRFDLDSVPAIKGNQTEIEERLLKLKDKGVVSAAYVREQLGIDENAAPDESTSTPEQEEIEEEKPQRDEQKEVENALFQLFKLQRQHVLSNLSKLTCGGAIMSVLCDPVSQTIKIYDTLAANKSTQNNLQPILRKILTERGIKIFEGAGVFDMEHELIDDLMRRMAFRAEDIIDQNAILLRAVLNDADRYNWTYRQLEKSVKRIFSLERSRDISHSVLTSFVSSVVSVLSEIKQQHNNKSLSISILT